MKHLEPTPQSPVPRARSKEKRKASGLAMVLASLVVIGGLGFGMTHFWGDAPGDSISDARRQELTQNFLQASSVQLERVADADVDKAIASMNLKPEQARILKQQLEKNATQPADQTTQLAWLDIWDFASQDGDIVHVSAAGYEMDVPMMNAQTRVAVPVDASKSVLVTGVVDGGGGITLGLKTGASELLLPVLAPGESLTVPVAL